MSDNTINFFPFKTTPYEHQLDCFMETRDEPVHALFMEMGTGKTKVVLDTIAYLHMDNEIDQALIIAPKSVYMNWYHNEIPQHLPCNALVAAWSSYLPSKKKAEFDGFMSQRTGDNLKILCMNIEALSGGRAMVVANSFIKRGKTLICVDESTTIKNMKAKRTKSCLKLARQCKYRRIMSGSPVTQSPLDLYSQCEFLGEGLLGFRGFVPFRSRYAEVIQMTLGSRTFPKIVGYKNIDELSDRLQKFSTRISKEECLDLPEKIYQVRHVELHPDQRRVYEELRDTCLLEIEEGQVAITSALTMITKLHQILCGHVKDDEGDLHLIPNSRLSVLMELLEEVDGKAIIWCNFVADVHLITNELMEQYGGESVVMFYGGVSTDDRSLNIEKFQTDPDCRFFVGTSQSGGMGITLTAASTVVYYSNSYKLETRLQSEDRAHRIGQLNRVTYVDLIVPKTLDEKIVRALKEKKNLADSVLEGWNDLTSI